MKHIVHVLTYVLLVPVILIISCGDDDETPLLVEAGFTVSDSSIVEGQEVTFTDASTGEPTSWEWTFEGGDPSTSTVRNPRVTYVTPGVFSIKLTASNGENAGTIEKEEFIEVIASVKAGFEVDDSLIVVGQEVTFTDTSTGGPTSWEWSFEGGDPLSSNDQNPKVTYATPGVYPVQLTASNDRLADREEKEELIRVFLPVEAGFTADKATIVEDEQITFTDNSQGDPSAWFWTFEGGTPSTSPDPNPTVTYTTAGTYRVSLSAINDASSDIEEKDLFITVKEKVEAQFEADELSINSGDEITFTDLSAGTPSSWQWTFPGGTPSTSTVSNPSVIYSTPGIYEVSLTASNEFDSDTETKSRYIVVSTVPVEGLIAYYPFNGNGTDSGNMGFDGILSGGVAPAMDRDNNAGGSLNFDGTDDYVEAPNDLDNTMSDGATFTAWIYLPEATGENMGILSNFNGQGDVSTGAECTPLAKIGFNFLVLPDLGLRMTYGTNADRFNGRRSPANSFETNTWYHVAGTWDGTTKSNAAFNLYINGIASDDQDFSSRVTGVCDEFVESDSPFYYGTASCAAGLCAPFKGRIDDLRIYDRALTRSEILALIQFD